MTNDERENIKDKREHQLAVADTMIDKVLNVQDSRRSFVFLQFSKSVHYHTFIDLHFCFLFKW